MTKLILMAGIVAGATVFAPQPVAAQSCTDSYEQCLNANHDKKGVALVLSDIECFAHYTRCISDILIL